MSSPVSTYVYSAGFSSGGSINANNFPAIASGVGLFLVTAVENNTGTAPTVSSIVFNSLTWTNRSSFNATFGSIQYRMEVWYAPVTSNIALNANTLTINMSSSLDMGEFVMFKVSGLAAYNPVSFDSNSNLPYTGFNSSGNVTVDVTTDQADDLLLWFQVNNAGATGDVPTGFTLIGDSDGSSTNFVSLTCAYKSVSATQSTVAVTSTSGYATMASIDAVTADVPPPSGTWASTGATDTMDVVGGILGGSWNSTETTDIMDFTSVPPHGTWSSTEGTDVMAATVVGPLPTYFDPTTMSAGIDLQDGNLTAVNQGAGSFNTPVGAKSNTTHSTGKFYVEFSTWLSANQSGVGIGNATATFAGWGATEGSLPGPAAEGAGCFQNQNGTIWVNGVEQTNWQGVSLNNPNAATIVGVAIDLDNNLIWFRTNGGSWNGISGANPATGADGYDISSITGGAIYLWAELYGAYDKAILNAGASSYAYPAPSGFSAWDAAPYIGTTLQIDGYATAAYSETGTRLSPVPVTNGTVTLTTTKANDVIVVGIVQGGDFNTGTVDTITDTAGLTWKKRNQRYQSGGYKNNGSTTINAALDIELWWAHAPTALTGDVITVTPTAGVGSMALVACGIAGANYLAPWDTHSNAGGYVDYIGNNTSSPAAAQLSTNAANVFLIGIHGDTTNDSGTAQPPWTYVASASGTEIDSPINSYLSFGYQIADEPQSGTNVLFGHGTSPNIYYSAQSVMFDSIVASGETGSTATLDWYWDPGQANNILQLTTGNSLQLGYNSTNFNLMVLVQVLILSASGLGEVTSISEGQGLLSSAGFERRSRVVTATTGGTLATEIWWGWMPMHTERATNDTITINSSGTVSGDIIAAQMWGLGGSTGAYGLGDPFWDPDPSVPSTNSANGDSPPPNATDISTVTPSTLLVAWTSNNTEPVPGSTTPFTTLVQASPNTIVPLMAFQSSAPPFYMGFEYLFMTGLASNETAEFVQATEPTGWTMTADAIPVGPPQPPTGIWASTEHKDTFSAAGFVPVQAAWHSTDYADEFTGAPQTVPFPGIGAGWLGWVPAHANWASTENKDQTVLYGWVIGFGPITGQIVAVETKDRLSFSNATTVTGKLGSTEHKDYWSSAGFPIPKARPTVPSKRRLLIVT